MPPKKPIPSKRDYSAARGRADAIQRLKDWYRSENGEELEFEESLQVTPLLKKVSGGIPTVIEALKAHDDDDAREFIRAYDSRTATDRRWLTLEQIAAASDISPLRLGEIANSALILHSKLATSMMLASHIPKVVQRSLTEAAKPAGLADREWMLKATGVLPTPKGAQIAIQTNVTPSGSATTVDAEPVYLDAGQRLRAIHDAVEGGQRKLPSPASDGIDLGDRIDRMQQNVAEVITETESVL